MSISTKDLILNPQTIYIASVSTTIMQFQYLNLVLAFAALSSALPIVNKLVSFSKFYINHMKI